MESLDWRELVQWIGRANNWYFYRGTSEDIDENNEWVCRPILERALAPREARACLEIAGYLANKGYSLSQFVFDFIYSTDHDRENLCEKMKRLFEVDNLDQEPE